jgi:hypothetical protein
MHDRRRQQVIARNLERKIRLVCCTALASVVLAACGGGGDSPVAQAVDSASSSGSPPANVVPPVQGSGGSPAAGVAGPAPSNAVSPPAGAASSSDDVAVAAAKGAITLSWTPPTTYEDGRPLKLTGYRIYWGAVEGHYPHSVTLTNPGLTRYVVDQLSPATWHFVATALSPEGESSFSNVFTMKVL